MTFVPGPLLRDIRLDSFADILPGVRVRVLSTGLSFGADLTPEQEQAVRDRISTRTPAELERRHALRVAMTGGALNLTQILAAFALGDPLPAPIYPPPEPMKALPAPARPTPVPAPSASPPAKDRRDAPADHSS